MEDQYQYNILYSCSDEPKYTGSQLVAEHALSYILSGEIQLYTNRGKETFKEGTIGLIRRNQLAKVIKIPRADGTPFHSINIFLDQESLHNYSLKNQLPTERHYLGEPFLVLPDDPFIQGFFSSLLPYFNQPVQLTAALAALKTTEIIELLIRNPDLKSFLFDFSEPFKIDIENFMNRNYMFHISINEFARLTGRSLATFKRDFTKKFSLPPEKWIRQKRLQQAHFLIAEQKQSPSTVYLEVGFENFSHFSRTFKEFYGYNPSQAQQNT